MKKNILVIVLSLFIVGLFLTTYNISTIGADSGFDTSYDSGGSWDSGASLNSDSDWGEDLMQSFSSLFIYFGGFLVW